MFALVDCNNFYASCERVFRPDLRNKPVIVLSNNDGCAIARSNEAKKLGIKMGAPCFQIEDIIKRNGVEVFSTNFTLYGDMSSRVMYLLSSFVEDVEIYSIDESFLNLKGYEYFDLYDYSHKIVDKTSRGTGIPLSMGVAPTKTLAKVANKFAKKYKKYEGVCIIDTEEKRKKALELTEIGNIWGIGRQHTKRLNRIGVKNAYQFTLLSREWIKKHMSVVGERTWRELKGESCLELEMLPPDKKSICTSRSFGEMITDYVPLSESVSSFAANCARKLRQQNSCAKSLMVFIHTNNFNPNLPQYFKNIVIELPVATDSTIEIVRYANKALEKIYRKGYHYKKSGVIITEIVPKSSVQLNLFHKIDIEKHNKLMKTLDYLNAKYYRNTVRLGAEGNGNAWKMKQEKLSKRYTTRLDETIEIKV